MTRHPSYGVRGVGGRGRSVVDDRNPVSTTLRAASPSQTLTRDGDVSGRHVMSMGKKRPTPDEEDGSLLKSHELTRC